MGIVENQLDIDPNTSKSDRCLIDVDLKVFAIWEDE